MKMLSRAASSLIFWFAAGTAAAAAPLSLAFTEDQVAWDQCAAYADHKVFPAPTRELLAPWLGLVAPEKMPAPAWTTGYVASEVRHFRIVFKQPIAVGTLVCPDAEVAVLRDDAPAPGDMADDAQWRPLAKRSVRPFDRNTKIRAVRITQRVYNLPWDAQRRPANFPGLWLLAGRFYSPAEIGFKRWSGVAGGIEWLGYWSEPVAVAGVLVAQPHTGAVKIATLKPSVKAHPLKATAADWQPAPTTPVGTLFALTGAPQISVMQLTTTQAPATPTYRPTPPNIYPLVEIAADAPTPDIDRFSFNKPAPAAINYQMPLDGFVAIRIEDEQGRHVRRLIAETERKAGPVREAWNLLDDNGRYVPPGKYRFVGLARPPLKLTYEMSVYSAGKPPWMAPVPGGGWWMADHSPPTSVCAVGDTMFMGAMGAEFGTPLIATDRDGVKKWHDLHHGALRLISDGRYAYVVNNGDVVRIDPQNGFAKHKLHAFQYSGTLPGHANAYNFSDNSGAAVFGNQLCVSYSAPSEPWILATAPIDLERCFPKPLPKKVHDTAMNPHEEILSTFQAGVSSTAASFGPTLKRGVLANTLIVTLHHEVPVGSVIVPSGDIEVHALRSGQTLPAAFIPGATPDDPLAPPKKDEDSLSDDLLEDFEARFDPKIFAKLTAGSGARPGVAVPDQGLKTKVLIFSGENLDNLDYSMILNRRYRNATPKARFVALEGKTEKDGSWAIRRTPSQPISYGQPAVAGYVWPQPIDARGFMLTRPLPWAGIAIDVWKGPADAPIDAQAFADNALWRQVHLHQQTRNSVKYNWHTDRVIKGDFGDVLKIRAIRVRIVEPPNGSGYIPRDAVTGGFESLIVFEPIGQDADLPIDLAQRLTVLELPAADGAAAKVQSHLRLPHPSALAFDRQGKLYAACDDGICRIDALTPAGVEAREVVIPRNAYGTARALAFDSEGLLYLLDGRASYVRVIDLATGKQVRQIGKPGGALGMYDPQELCNPAAMCIDGDDKVWIVEHAFQPKRITRWSKTGEVEKELLGPTHYGGGGMLDPGDKSVINHLGMKFRIDYATRTWKLESRLAPYGGGMYLPDRVFYYKKHRFLAGDRPVVTPFGDDGPTSVIAQEVSGAAVPRVLSGVLGDWRELPRNPALQQAAQKVDPSQTAFVWSDLNADRQVQVVEVLFVPGLSVKRAPFIGDDLSLNFSHDRNGARLRIKELREPAPGVFIPIYDVAQLESVPELTEGTMVAEDGETFVMEHKLLDPAGQRQWTYPDRYRSVQASNQVPWGFTTRPPGEICGSFGAVGHFEIAGERLYCVGSNNGDYYAFTRDGLLAAAIVGGPRGYGLRYFSMPDCVPGKTDLTDLRKTVEDFHGHVTRAEDGNVYAIAGKNHITLIRVDGLEGMKRFDGTVEITRDDLDQTREWAARKAQNDRLLSPSGPKEYPVAYLKEKPEIDGNILIDWPAVQPVMIHETRGATGDISTQWQAQMAFDQDNLYLGGTAIDHSPMINSAPDPQVLFQHGDALDLNLGLDPQADPNRIDPVAGDIRLLVTYRHNKPVVMLYRYVTKPGAEPQRVFRSPVGETAVAEIRELKEAQVELIRIDRRWTLEVAIPWKSLGVAAPSKSVKLRGDLGALESDPNGQSTVARHYWANKQQVIMGDQPAEARVLPGAWGEFQFQVPDLVESLID